MAVFPGGPSKIAAAIIASAEQTPAPKRLTNLGSGAYALVHAALKERLTSLKAQKELAYSTDVNA